MTKLSRRKLLAGAIAVPALQPAAVALPIPGKANPDLIVAKSAEWVAADNRLRSIQQTWRTLETILFKEAKRNNVHCGEARKGSTPEARAMRGLDVEIEETYARLDVLAAEAWETPATTIAGAIAKIELGLKVQGPFDWRDYALELMEDGIRELRELLTKARAGEFSSFR